MNIGVNVAIVWGEKVRSMFSSTVIGKGLELTMSQMTYYFPGVSIAILQ